jgi:hypothetical protein
MPIFRAFAAVIAVAAATASGPVAAQSYADPATGLSVDPPKPYAARPGQPRLDSDVTIEVFSTTHQRPCLLMFKKLPQDVSASKARIKARINGLIALMAKHKIEQSISDLSSFEHQG